MPSPIAPGKHSDRPGNRDEDFQAVASALAKYLEVRRIDAQIISPHPLQFHGWMEDDILFKSWIGYQNDLAFKIAQAQPNVLLAPASFRSAPKRKTPSTASRSSSAA